MADYVNPGVVAGIGFDNFFRQQKADQIEAAKQELESHINALKLKAAQQDVEDQQVAKLQKRAIAEESQLMPGDYVPPDMQERRKAANLPPLREKVLPGLDEAQGPTQQGATLADPSRIYMPVQAELAQQKAAEQQQMAEQQAAKSQAMQAAYVAASQAPDRATAARIILEAGGDPQKVDQVFKPAAEAAGEQPIVRINPRNGRMEILGTAPKGAHFVTEPPPVNVNVGQGGMDSLSDAALTFRAETQLAGGPEPAFGSGTQGAIARAKYNEVLARVAADRGISGADLARLTAQYKANTSSLAQLQKNSDAVNAFMNTADANAGPQGIESVLGKIPDAGYQVVNSLWRPMRGNMTAESQAALSTFNTFRKSLQDEYARIVAQPNLAGQLTDSARREMETIINPNATVASIRAALSALRAEGQNREASFNQQINAVGDRISPSRGENASPADRQKRIDAVKAKYGLK